MPYRLVKWAILLLPPLAVGLWEYVRHEFLLPYVSMEAGNWLTPVLVFAVSMVFLRPLLRLLERMQHDLHRAQVEKAAYEERANLARELHDGIAQTLFWLAVKLDRIGRALTPEQEAVFHQIRQTVRQLSDDVRQAIANLQVSPSGEGPEESGAWPQAVRNFVDRLRAETDLEVHVDWPLPDERLSNREKVELLACLREALANVRKHARARSVHIWCGETERGWALVVEDDGRGFTGCPFEHPDGFGLKILRDRAERMGWSLRLSREDGRTRFEVRKEGMT